MEKVIRKKRKPGRIKFAHTAAETPSAEKQNENDKYVLSEADLVDDNKTATEIVESISKARGYYL